MTEQPQRKRKRHRASPFGPMKDVARRLFVEQGLTPAAIEEELLRRYPDAPDFPGKRTIESWVAAFRTEGGEPWMLTLGTEETAELVLPVLQAVVEHSEGRVRTIGIETARWVVAVRRAAADLDPWDAFLVARQYVAAAGASTSGLDWLLAYAPWRGPSEAARYGRAITRGLVIPHPGMDIEMWRQQDGEVDPAEPADMDRTSP